MIATRTTIITITATTKHYTTIYPLPRARRRPVVTEPHKRLIVKQMSSFIHHHQFIAKHEVNPLGPSAEIKYNSNELKIILLNDTSWSMSI